jgi:hypothetical protein
MSAYSSESLLRGWPHTRSKLRAKKPALASRVREPGAKNHQSRSTCARSPLLTEAFNFGHAGIHQLENETCGERLVWVLERLADKADYLAAAGLCPST